VKKYIISIIGCIILLNIKIFALNYSIIKGGRGFIFNYPLPSSRITALANYEDKFLIIGTYGGLSIFDGKVFKNYTADTYEIKFGRPKLKKGNSELPDNHINDIYIHDKKAYIATDKGMCVIKLTNFYFSTFSPLQMGLERGMIQKISLLDKNRLLVGTWGEGMLIFNIKTHVWQTVSEAQNFTGRYITTIYKDKSVLLVGTLKQGFFIYRPAEKKFENFNTRNSIIPSNRIRCIKGVKDGVLISCGNKLIKFNPTKKVIIDEIKTEFPVTAMYFDKSTNSIYIGTRKGIIVKSLYFQRKFVLEDPFLNEIKCIEKFRNKVYVGTRLKGVLVFEKLK